MNSEERYYQAKKATIISATINFLLAVAKVIGGFIYNSHALIADGFHSFSDLLTDAMVLFASKYGSLDADKNHPYGHQRIETAATLFLSMLLILAGAGISYDALHSLIFEPVETPDRLALVIVAISIFSNEFLYHYTKYIGIKINSELLITNAWHHRSDAASSLVVFIGVMGSLMGIKSLDAVAAIIVGLLIVKMGWNYSWNSVKELVDTAAEPELLEKIRAIISEINGVDKIHQLRSRLMGGDIFIDVHIQVNPYLSVSEGHYIAQHVHKTLTERLKRVKDVTVHVDPEDDEICCPSFHLPNRKTIDVLFISKVKEAFPELEYCNLHYLDGKLCIDLYLKKGFDEWKKLQTLVEHQLKPLSNIKTVRFFAIQPALTLE